MFNFGPILREIKSRTVVFYMAIFAGLRGPVSEACLWGRCMISTGTVTHLALNIFQVGCIQFADKPTRKVKANHMTN